MLRALKRVYHQRSDYLTRCVFRIPVAEISYAQREGNRVLYRHFKPETVFLQLTHVQSGIMVGSA